MDSSDSEKESISSLTESRSSLNNCRVNSERAKGKNTCRQRRWWRNCKYRGLGSSSLLLILAWYFITGASLQSSLNRLEIELTNENTSTGFFLLLIEKKKIFAILVVLLVLSIPVASLFGGVAISRYKLVSYTLKLMWTLSIVNSTLTMFEPFFSKTTALHLCTARLVVVLGPQVILFGAFTTCVVPLGLDQISSGSSANISSFIHWLVWTFYSGIAIPGILDSAIQYCSNLKQGEKIILSSLFPVMLLSVGLIMDFCFSNRLLKEPVTANPITHIFEVLRYAIKHKQPVQRSAFTYCNNERPCRLDNGKTKYGGPFTTEQVEDVKTFWRVFVVLFVISILCFPLGMHMAAEHKHLFVGNHHLICSVGHVTTAVTFALILIPIYELVIYPCLRNRAPRILQSVGLGAAALIVLSLYGLIAETIKYSYFTYNSSGTDHNSSITNRTIQCLFSPAESCFTSYIPFNIIQGFTLVVLAKSIIDFICAQTPYNMKGLMIGVAFTALLMFVIPGVLLIGVWDETVRRHDSSRCGIWFFLTSLSVTVVASILLVVVVRRYKARERDDIAMSQAIVEEVYYKYQQQELTWNIAQGVIKSFWKSIKRQE